MPEGRPQRLDFDSVTIWWPAGPDRATTRRHRDLYETLRDELPENDGGFEVGGYGTGLQRLEVNLTADAGRGAELLTWARQAIERHGAPTNTTLTLECAEGLEHLDVEVRLNGAPN